MVTPSLRPVSDKAANCEFRYALGARDEVELLTSGSGCGDGLLLLEELLKDGGCDPLPLQAD